MFTAIYLAEYYSSRFRLDGHAPTYIIETAAAAAVVVNESGNYVAMR